MSNGETDAKQSLGPLTNLELEKAINQAFDLLHKCTSSTKPYDLLLVHLECLLEQQVLRANGVPTER